MIHKLTTIEEAQEILKYYNYFHDGFIKNIVINSHDEFEPDKSQLCTGTFDLEILFAHYNYAQGTKPYKQTIKAYFQNVRDIYLDFRDVTFDWAINTLEIFSTTRRNVYQSHEPCLAVRLVRNHLDDSQQWVLKELDLFTFTGATFKEQETEND